MRLRRFLRIPGIDTPTTSIDVDDVYRILDSHRRRALIMLLDERDASEHTLDELARSIAARENDADAYEVSETEYDRVYVSLFQSGLPQLEDQGVVDWDADTGRVRTRPPVATLADVHREVQRRTE